MPPVFTGRGMGFFITPNNDIRHFPHRPITAYDGCNSCAGWPNPRGPALSQRQAGIDQGNRRRKPSTILKTPGDTAMNDTSTSMFGSLINIFMEPRKTLESLRGHASWWWLPVVLMVVLYMLFQVWYINRVDISWFADQALAPSADKMTADQMREAHARFTPTGM